MKLASFFLIVSSILPPVLAEEDHRKCACEARDRGFAIDCGNEDAMRAAVAQLITNKCEVNCESAVCLRNFYILLAHHDYCLESEVPESVEDALHIYEDTCEECDILKKFDAGLPNCPAPNCENDSGTIAFNTLTNMNCLADCSSTMCVSNFRTLKAVHDLCDEDALSSEAELGFHDLEEACEDASCNVGDAALEAEQLVCDEPLSQEVCDTGTFDVAGLGCICFSGASTVQTLSGSKVPLSELQIGDVVLTSNGKYERVYGFAHYAPNAVAEFLELTTADDIRAPLQVSEQHRIRAHDGSYVPAISLKQDDKLYHGYPITDIRTVPAKGVFAPYTPSGTIVVDGLEASCYVMPDMPLFGWTLSGQWLAHSFEFPHRVARHYLNFGSSCDRYTEHGIHAGKVRPMQWFGWLLTEASVGMRTALMTLSFVVLVAFNVIEWVVFQQPLVALAACSLFYLMGANKKLMK